MRIVYVVALGALVGGCGESQQTVDSGRKPRDLSEETFDPLDFSMAQPEDLTASPVPPDVDMAEIVDLASAMPPDFSAGCTLGGVDNCASCGDVCLPNYDDETVQRTCDRAKATPCDIVCKGEFYDIDNLRRTGCEVQDWPLQDSAATAREVILEDRATNETDYVSQIYGDARKHDAAPVTRLQGRPDWYKVTALGNGSSNSTMVACLSINNLPSDNTWKVCISTNGSTDPTSGSCLGALGGQSGICVHPPGMPDTGVFMVSVQRVAGRMSENQYSLWFNH